MITLLIFVALTHFELIIKFEKDLISKKKKKWFLVCVIYSYLIIIDLEIDLLYRWKFE